MSTAAAYLAVDPPTAAAPRGSEHEYLARRTAAFSLAARGSIADSLAELRAAWNAGDPSEPERALDLGWVRLLRGNPRSALEGLRSSLTDGGEAPADTYRLVGECVRADPSLRELALCLAIATRSPLQRARIVLAALAARPLRDDRLEAPEAA